ncbi:phosphoribosylaminoimidazole synthetase [Arcobacter sp. LA11]|uniref:phosphoribosylaminoimidazole synthetase n=1 Tax=Arcobacter sp. LA11 TaxID=1898176 RepID=UPI00093368E2|nr:phosphoribosylaminoimidazole synthetase [Arcobacter sp. LA11]
MCAEKLQRILMAIVLTVSLFLLLNGSIFGIVLQVFVISMVLIWAFTDFCPSLWAFKKMFGACEKKENKENNGNS